LATQSLNACSSISMHSPNKAREKQKTLLPPQSVPTLSPVLRLGKRVNMKKRRMILIIIILLFSCNVFAFKTQIQYNATPEERGMLQEVMWHLNDSFMAGDYVSSIYFVNKIGRCGYSSSAGRVVINMHKDCSPYFWEIMTHELGHAYWFREMTPAARQKYCKRFKSDYALSNSSHQFCEENYGRNLNICCMEYYATNFSLPMRK
jgi:hypothetical protein